MSAANYLAQTIQQVNYSSDNCSRLTDPLSLPLIEEVFCLLEIYHKSTRDMLSYSEKSTLVSYCKY